MGNLKRLLRETMLQRFAEDVEKSVAGSVTVPSSLGSLLKEANTAVFDKFDVEPKDKKYFIAGSARLYLYPTLTDVLSLKSVPADLDIVISDTTAWSNFIKANSQDPNLDSSKYIFRPDDKIEAFKEWKPQIAVSNKGEVKDTSVRSTSQIQSDAKLVAGYYFMSMYDILDYKLQLNRDKEQQISQYLLSYHTEKNTTKKQEIANTILDAFKGDESQSKTFLNPNLAKKISTTTKTNF